MAAKKKQGGFLRWVSGSGIPDAKTLKDQLHILRDDVEEAGFQAVSMGTDLMKSESIRRAPVDTVDLARCHASIMDHSTHKGIISGTVFIDDTQMRFLRDHSMVASEYAVYAHELIKNSMNPMAPLNLGEDSRKKNMGREVGGKFLERAVLDSAEDVAKLIANEIKKIFEGK